MKSDNPEIKRLLGTEGQVRRGPRPDQRLGLPHHQAGRQLRRDLRTNRRRRAPRSRSRAASTRSGPRAACNTRRRSADPLSGRRVKALRRCSPRGPDNRRRAITGAGACYEAGRAVRLIPRYAASRTRCCSCAVHRSRLVYDASNATPPRHLAAGQHRVRLRLLAEHAPASTSAAALIPTTPRQSTYGTRLSGSGCSTRCWSPLIGIVLATILGF